MNTFWECVFHILLFVGSYFPSKFEALSLLFSSEHTLFEVENIP